MTLLDELAKQRILGSFGDMQCHKCGTLMRDHTIIERYDPRTQDIECPDTVKKGPLLPSEVNNNIPIPDLPDEVMAFVVAALRTVGGALVIDPLDTVLAPGERVTVSVNETRQLIYKLESE